MNTTRDDWLTSEGARSALWPRRWARPIQRHWKMLLTVYSMIVLAVIITFVMVATSTVPSSLASPQRLASHKEPRGIIEKPFDPKKRSWGGFDERPLTATCYEQERTAMLLALILGCLGVDQFYARHWALAVFKLLTLGGLGTWWFIDLVLWDVGGVYGTPGCPGGSEHSWQF